MNNVGTESKETYEKTVEARLGRLGSRIDEFQIQAEKLGGKAKADFLKWLDELRMKQAAVNQKFREMKEAGGDIWMDIKAGLERSATDLKETLDRVGPKIKDFPYPHIKPAGKWIGLLLGGVVAGYFIGRLIHKTNKPV